jgi:LmbE family N-acetylglucosaminyl deacetylase
MRFNGDIGPITMVGVWAHPDDEAYLSAGLMARVVEAGGRVVVVTATCGEKGTDDPDEWPPDRLASLRRREMRASLAAVGVDEHRFLGFADGACDLVVPSVGASLVAEVIDDVRPDIVVTFGPDGMTGHPDHIAVSAWATEAWSTVGSGALLYATKTATFAGRFASLHDELGIFPPGLPATVVPADAALDLQLSTTEFAAKRAALAGHRSQTQGLADLLGEETYGAWAVSETFRFPRPGEITSIRRAA